MTPLEKSRHGFRVLKRHMRQGVSGAKSKVALGIDAFQLRRTHRAVLSGTCRRASWPRVISPARSSLNMCFHGLARDFACGLGRPHNVSTLTVNAWLAAMAPMETVVSSITSLTT